MAKTRIDVHIVQPGQKIDITHSQTDKELTDEQFERLQIFKVQIPISTNVPEDESLALIYNEARDIEFHVPAKEVKQYFQAGEFKRYLFGYEEQGIVQLFNLPKIPNEDMDW